MEALSDWTGHDGNSRTGIDYHDREAGTVVYKGDYFLEYKTGVTVTANFTLKVRCKDGMAQVRMMIFEFFYWKSSRGRLLFFCE